MEKLKVTLPLVIIAIVLLTYPIICFWEMFYVVNYYQETTGKVLTSKVDRFEVEREDGKRFAFKPNISYQYEVNAVKYWGNRYDYRESHSISKLEAHLVAKEYAPQKEIIIFYDPKSPDKSLLSKEVPSHYYGGFVGIVICLCLLTHICVVIFKSKVVVKKQQYVNFLH